MCYHRNVLARWWRAGRLLAGVTPVHRAGSEGRTAAPGLYETTAAAFMADKVMGEEVFGPLGLVVRVDAPADMVALAGGSVLYTTSNIMRGFPANAEVAAAMQLFAGIAMMFWYVLRLFMGSRR